MATDLRTDSLDYRIEFLYSKVHKNASKFQDLTLNMDEFKLPAERSMDSYFGLGTFIKSLKRQRKIAHYYKRQNKLLKGFYEIDSFSEMGFWPGSLTQDEVNQLAGNERIAIYASNVANLSRSLAVIASTLDSLIDLLSGFILWFTSHAMRKPNQYRYPISKARMQPVIALYTIGNWAKTVMENVWSLIGKTAPAEYLAKLTYLIWNHDKEIKHIDKVRAYTFGCNYFVEADIVLPGDMSLSHAHNIGETLQEKIENLPEVERAFVHVRLLTGMSTTMLS
ncbi:metal tolerance protein 10-like [Pyrus ussuriensis x Pyrus communis]|uniref:Metal tolerance protein 10-like n=1 Tax=Pyrus ussuriensis x Pyrus communis TaxID=2448454 RepID=A0A5N5ICR9_9ROSA|nr:metal tolerance protein 10-like [Pyrus ussuriensis x Pyrus communis]